MPSLQYTRQAPAYFNGSWFIASLVPPTRSSSCLQAHCHAVQSIACWFLCSSSMETSHHSPHTKNLCTQTSHRLSTNLHHSSFNSCHGANSRTTIHVSCLLVTTSNIDIIRPVCLPPNRFHNSCAYQFPQHHHKHATHQSLRHSYRSWLQQSIWYGAAFNASGKAGSIGYARQCI